MRRLAGLAFGVGLAVSTGALAAAAPGYHVIDKIPIPDGGWDYARVDPAVDRVFVTRGNSVMAIDLATKQVTSGLVPGAREHIALPVEGGREILVTEGGSDTAVFADAKTGASLGQVATGKGPDAAAIDPRSGLVMVMAHAGGKVTLVDPKTRAAVGEIDVGGTLEEGAADGSGRGFVSVESAHEIAVLDLKARKVAARWPLPGCDGPTGLAYNPRDKLLIAACDGATAVVRAADGHVVAMLPTGKGADGAAYDARQRLAFIPAGRDGTLSVIGFSGGKPQVLETVPTQRGARTIALDERTGRLYLPSATYVVSSQTGRPTPVGGTAQVIVVGK
jgi:DNA-binding beta-propeller fold protein YncE